MEDAPPKEINFLTKPLIDPKKLKYVVNSKKVYANLYEIFLTKTITLYQYPFKVDPEIEAGDVSIRQIIQRSAYRELKSIYGEFIISGDSLFGINKIEEMKNVLAVVYSNGRKEYKLLFQKCANERIIKQEDVRKDPLAKQFLELIIRDILHSNPKLEFFKDIFVLTTDEQPLEHDGVSVLFYPGFTTSFMETDSGNFLNVTLKNKIIQKESVLDYLNYYYEGFKKDKNIQKEINEDLKGRPFKVSYAKKNYRIDAINFDLSPYNNKINYKGKTRSLVEYYQLAHELKIKDINQPLIEVKKKDAQGLIQTTYYVPELCSLSGLEDSDRKNGKFMQELAYYTKLEPNDRVKKTDEFIKLLYDDSTDEKHPISAKAKREKYGIEIKPTSNLFDAYYMQETRLLAGKVKGKNKLIKSSDKTFPVLEKAPMTSWVCFYEQRDYNAAEKLFNTMVAASKAYEFKISEPEWVELANNSKPKVWIERAEEYFPRDEESDYDFAVFLVGKNSDDLYPILKKHSICRNGYISQIVKSRTIGKKGGFMSVCSKILLQINAKLGGISYKVDLDKVIKDSKLMIVGVDSSHIKGMRTGVAMVATINDSFTDFYNKEEIIKEENKAQLKFCVSSFIEEAIEVFKKQKINKNEYPKGIVIYRQGVSLQQKEYIKDEIRLVDKSCKDKGIPYYYILVNTKTTFKFFEKTNNGYVNPHSGLLILDGITNKNFFEFYIQPQQVTQGSATPSCFHVAYGNLDCPAMIPKLTFDLCHIYSNWQGTVRIPNVIKAAEKLAKITAKYTLGELNENLQSGQAYL